MQVLLTLKVIFTFCEHFTHFIGKDGKLLIKQVSLICRLGREIREIFSFRFFLRLCHEKLHRDVDDENWEAGDKNRASSHGLKSLN